MKAQILYDFREETEMFSGADLHEFFHEQVGDPSPSGYIEVDGEEATKFVWGSINSIKANSPSMANGCQAAKDAWLKILDEHSGEMRA